MGGKGSVGLCLCDSNCQCVSETDRMGDSRSARKSFSRTAFM